MTKYSALLLLTLLLTIAACDGHPTSTITPMPTITPNINATVTAIVAETTNIWTAAPTAEFLYAILWLGKKQNDGAITPVGSGVVVHLNDEEYLATALHVAKESNFNPLIRRGGIWKSVQWTTVGTEEDTDIAVLQTSAETLSHLTPRYGIAGTFIGMAGRAMGFPDLGTSKDIHHFLEEDNGIPIPLTVLVSSYISDPESPIHFAGGYANAGFSGGAMLLPTSDGWTIAGIITHRAHVDRPVLWYNPNTENTEPVQNFRVMEPSGLIRFTDFKAVKRLIAESEKRP